MGLAPGDRLGRYQVVGQVGAGAMGEVYRAQDPELDRQVAIKVLPDELSADPARLERFEREARAVGRLHHPNLMAIHDLGRHQGAPYLVCELLTGETLQERLSRGAVSLREALQISAQVANGLAAAHASGVIHRDLKPANLFLTAEGRAKVLDFGLAKLAEPASLGESRLPTLAEVTEPGMVMGTAAYMAPEQAAGKQVDHRADQFALGVVLYEMLAGRRPFEGETAAETMTAILRHDPPPLAQVAPQVPPPVRWIAERCLSRDPEDRYDSTRDLAKDLQMASDRLSDLGLPAVPSMGGAPKRRSPVFLAAAAAGLLVGVLLMAFLGFGRGAGLQQLGYERITFGRGVVSGARWVPDGSGVLYSAAWDGAPSRLYLHRPGDLDPIPLGPPGAELLSVSTQSESLLLTDLYSAGPFLRAGTLNRMPIGGGPRALRERVATAAFGPDGQLGAVVTEAEGQMVVEFPPGTPRLITRGMVLDLRLSPDGGRVAFVETDGRGRNVGPLVVLERDGDAIRFPEAQGGAGLAWSPSGREVWYSRPTGTSLHAIDLDGRQRQLATFPAAVFIYDVSPQGRALIGVEQGRLEAVGRPAGGEERPLTWLAWSVPFDLSAAGERVLFNECSGFEQLFCRIVLRTFGTEPPVVLGEGFGMSLSPDGEWVLSILPWEERSVELFATGHDERRILEVKGVEGVSLGLWSPDGRSLFLSANFPGEGNRIFTLGLDGGTPVPVTPEGIAFGFFATSPDGRYVAASLLTGGVGIYPVEGGEPTYLDHDGQPIRWSADGGSLFTVPLAAAPAPLSRVDIASGTTELVALLMPPDPAGVLQISPVAITPDGTAYVYGYTRRLTDLFVVDGLE